MKQYFKWQRETTLLTENDTKRGSFSTPENVSSHGCRDRGVNGSELTLLLKTFLFLQCHVVWLFFFLANRKDKEPMKSQNAGLIQSGHWTNCSHVHQEKSHHLIYANIKIWKVYHTQRVDENKALLIRSASSFGTPLPLSFGQLFLSPPCFFSLSS